MADPKYANLPGIAHDEPDVYETSDLPESEQPVDFYEEENESVEKIHVEVGQAYNKFKGKYLDPKGVDFSERISKKNRTGYEASSGDYELAGNTLDETVLQKHQRLQCEMKELLEEIDKIKSASKNETEKTKDILVTDKLIEQSLKQLADLKLEESLGLDVVSTITDPQGNQIKKLLSQIEQFKTNIKNKPEAEKATDSSGLVYQFNYKPEQTKLQQTTRIAELETRLHRLENVLGASDDKLVRLSSLTNKKSLFEAAQQLSATASLLDSSQLDHIEGRLAALAQKLEAISEKKKQNTEDEDKDKMILELFELVKNSENISKLLPQTIERLKALENLHKKATDFTKTLTQLEIVQADIKSNVENNKTLLQGVQESFAVNLNEINQTVANLDGRIKNLKKK